MEKTGAAHMNSIFVIFRAVDGCLLACLIPRLPYISELVQVKLISRYQLITTSPQSERCPETMTCSNENGHPEV